MYPKVFLDWNAHWGKYGDVSVLPTPVFFYGMSPGEEVTIEGDPGKTLILRYLAVSEPHADGTRTAFFELNGAPRSVSIADRALQARSNAGGSRRCGQSRSRRRADARHDRDRGGQSRATRWSAATCCCRSKR